MLLSRRYRMDRMYEPKSIRSEMSTDTMDPRSPGLHGDKKCQVFGNKQMVVAAYPSPPGRGDGIDKTLKKFIQDYGTPDSTIILGVKAQISRRSAFIGRLRWNNITSTISNSTLR